MAETLSRDELARLVDRVFRLRATDRALAVLVDLPDARVPDRTEWSERRRMAAQWWSLLNEARETMKLETVDLVAYRNVRRNNADFPEAGWRLADGRVPASADEVRGDPEPFERLFAAYSILIAPTEFSATAPLKLASRRYGFRAATMPGFCASMIPALRLDYTEVHRRCLALKRRLDEATAADLAFQAAGRRHELRLDLRHRTATASGGLVTEPATAGNLPSGETYIVPYEGELQGDPSRSRGTLPLELDGELVYYRIEGNRTVEVLGDGPRAAAEREQVATEPGYRNVAELGLGVLADYGIRPVGRLLLDEKLGLHIAFGRSDHFGGTVGAADFSAPDRVVHIDRVYIPEVQPQIHVLSVDLDGPGGTVALMRDGRYVAQAD